MKRILLALLALAFAGAVSAQVNDPVGGGAQINITAGSINCTKGLCTIQPNSLLGIVGTVTSDVANTGAVGEYVTGSVGSSAAATITTCTIRRRSTSRRGMARR